MVIRNTYPNHGHSGDFLCFCLDELLMSLRRNHEHLNESYWTTFYSAVYCAMQGGYDNF